MRDVVREFIKHAAVADKAEMERLREAVKGSKSGKTYPISRFFAHPVTHAAGAPGNPIGAAANIAGRYAYPAYVKGEGGVKGAFGRYMNRPQTTAKVTGGIGAVGGALAGAAYPGVTGKKKALAVALGALLGGGAGAGAGALGALVNRFVNRRALAGRTPGKSMFESATERKLAKDAGK